jgi:hypothetical protein
MITRCTHIVLHVVERRLFARTSGVRLCSILLLALSILGPDHRVFSQPERVNFAHLRHLTEHIVLNRDSVDIVHVYADYPSYNWVEAADAGVEGTACVDDAARAAVLYLRHWLLTGDEGSMMSAKRLLKFVLAMQADDGEFYNFLYRDHTINRTGRTSVKSFGWWAARAMWALGTGAGAFEPTDPSFAARLRRAFLRGLAHVDTLLQRYGEVDTLKGFAVPRWLPYDSGADVTSELLLGLTAYGSTEHDAALRGRIRELADGLMVMQDGSAGRRPWGVHRSWETQWHMWGNAQTQVLAEAGKALGDSDMISSARREADGFFSRLLIDGFLKECDLARPHSVRRFEQIAYGVRPMAVGLIRLYEATRERSYAIMAGLAGSWLFGNNILGRAMYDPSTGRCYDGITDSVSLNRNAGAESTIEALLTVLEVEHVPEAMPYLTYRKVSSTTTKRLTEARFVDASGNEIIVGVSLPEGHLFIREHRSSENQ